MLVKFYYLILDSSKNLFRTKGAVSTFLLSMILSVISFFSLESFLFLTHMQQKMNDSLEKETDFIEIQMSKGPIIVMNFFKIALFLLSTVLILLTVGTIKKSFKQFLVIQEEDYKIKALLGENLVCLKLFYAFQIVLFSLLPIFWGSIVGKKIFYESIIKTIQLGMFSEDVNSYNGNLLFLLIVLLIVFLYLFVSSFISSDKKIKAFIYG